MKSNALYGLVIGVIHEEEPRHGWAVYTGKSTYRAPGTDNEGSHQFFIYTEDHGDQGCNQEPDETDRFWVEVWDKDDNTVLHLGDESPSAYENAVEIDCGNIVVPHTSTDRGK